MFPDIGFGFNVIIEVYKIYHRWISEKQIIFRFVEFDLNMIRKTESFCQRCIQKLHIKEDIILRHIKLIRPKKKFPEGSSSGNIFKSWRRTWSDRIYSRTSRMCVVMVDFPPVGSARTLPQTLQTTLRLALPKMICSFSQLLHLTRRNLLFGRLV